MDALNHETIVLLLNYLAGGALRFTETDQHLVNTRG